MCTDQIIPTVAKDKNETVFCPKHLEIFNLLYEEGKKLSGTGDSFCVIEGCNNLAETMICTIHSSSGDPCLVLTCKNHNYLNNHLFM